MTENKIKVFDASSSAEIIWKKYEKDLENLCKARLRNSYRDYVDDCMQEVFLALLEYIKRNGEPPNPKAWLYRTAFNKIMNVFREKNEKIKHEVSVDTLYDSAEYSLIESNRNLAGTATDEEIERDRKLIIQSLTEDEQTLLFDFAVRKLTNIQLSEKYGVSVSTVKRRRFRLKKKIYDLVRKHSDEFYN
ncbi:MAG: RNA polymerase sigma factor [Acutalibacteraceae bacterium]